MKLMTADSAPPCSSADCSRSSVAGRMGASLCGSVTICLLKIARWYCLSYIVVLLSKLSKFGHFMVQLYFLHCSHFPNKIPYSQTSPGDKHASQAE
jgi:hypothetical protein